MVPSPREHDLTVHVLRKQVRDNPICVWWQAFRAALTADVVRKAKAGICVKRGATSGHPVALNRPGGAEAHARHLDTLWRAR